MAAKTRTRKPLAPRACECSWWYTGDVDSETQDVYDEERTGCTATTTREFAPGHDARLKSFLIRAGINGTEVHDGRGLSGSADALAVRFGFYPQVTNGIIRGLAKADQKVFRQQAREARREARRPVTPVADIDTQLDAAFGPVETPEPVAPQSHRAMVRVGRWTYEADVLDGVATYRDRSDRVHSTRTYTYQQAI